MIYLEEGKLFDRSAIPSFLPFSYGGQTCSVDTMNHFPDERACLTFSDEIRCKDVAFCPFCASTKGDRNKKNNQVNQWNPYDCSSVF